MHTLYMIYDGSGKVTDFVIDDVPTTQNFISFDRGPLSYIQSIIDNLNAYAKKNGSLMVENSYLGEVRHGQFDETYGEIEDKRTENPNYTFKSGTPTSSAAPASSSAASEAAPSSTAPTSSTASETTSSAATPSK